MGTPVSPYYTPFMALFMAFLAKPCRQDIVNLNHSHKKVPLSPEMSVSSRVGDGVPSHHRPRRELNGRSPAPPVRGFFLFLASLADGSAGVREPRNPCSPSLAAARLDG